MKHRTFLLPLVLLAWVSCGSQPAAPTRRAAGDAESASQQRKDYQEKAEAELRELNQRIEALNAKAAPRAKAARKEVERQIAELDHKRAALQQQLEKFKHSSQAAWRDMKPGIDSALKDLDAAYQRAAADFKQAR